jgi:sugar O-acyltransferase (sialic acid O-acetyltransferase NeuD family)
VSLFDADAGTRSGLRVIGAEHQAEWEELLLRARRHDFYHLPSYHLLADKRGEGKARLFVYQDRDRFVALPLLIRSIESVPGLESAGKGLYDATSVYGYAGPLTSKAELTGEFLDDFRRALLSALREARVVAVFSRLHPLIDQQAVLSGLGESQVTGRTVSIDLTLPPDVQSSQYRQGHRYEINRLRRMGATCQDDTELHHLDEFVSMYGDTMARAGATGHYLFERDYFRDIVLMSGAHLFICTLNGETICGGLFVLCGGIVQYHLSGVRPEYQKLAPTKLMIDEVRLWANEQKAAVLHLGGGLGSQGDSLFDFKAGFSDRRHEFSVWRWVVEPVTYESLCSAKEVWNRRSGLRSVTADYFPAYRSPTAPVGEAVGADNHPDLEFGGQPGPSHGGHVQRRSTGMRVLIIGAGGHGQVVADILVRMRERTGTVEPVGYLDDNSSLSGRKLLGLAVLGTTADLSSVAHDAVIVAIGDNAVRSRLFGQLRQAGERLFTACHPQVVIAPDVTVGAGTMVCAGVVIDPGCMIGSNVILNTCSCVTHNSRIADHVHIGVGARVGAELLVAEGALVGMGATLTSRKSIGAWSVVGAGACVTKSVPAGVTVVGVPAMAVQRRG